MTLEQLLHIFKDQPVLDYNMEIVTFKHGYQIYEWMNNEYSPVGRFAYGIDGLFEIFLERTENFYIKKHAHRITHEISPERRDKIDEILMRLEDAYRSYQ